MRKLDELKQELQAKKEEMRSLLDADRLEEAKALKEEMRKLQEKIELEAELEEQEERELETKIETRKVDEKMENKSNLEQEYRDIAHFLLTGEKRDSMNIGNSGAILPEAFVNQLQVLKDGFPSLKRFVHVIGVTTNSGKMPISQGSTNKKLAKLATDTEMVKEMITTKPVEYQVEDYGKIYPVENSVLEDAGVNFFNELLAPDIAECSVNTENEEILAIVKATAKAGATGSDYKAIQKTINKIVPALKSGTVIITNQDGYDYLDGIVDANGRPLLTDSLAVEGGKRFKGHEVVVMDNADLPEVTAGKLPFYVVNLYALVKFFDRKKYEVATSKEAGFTYNQTFVRVVERFDAVKGDDRACFLVEING